MGDNRSVEIKNCVLIVEKDEKDAILSITPDGFYIKIHDYVVMPKRYYDEVLNKTVQFPIFLLSCILFLISAFVLYVCLIS